MRSRGSRAVGSRVAENPAAVDRASADAVLRPVAEAPVASHTIDAAPQAARHTVEGIVLEDSLVGFQAIVTGRSSYLNVGDLSQITS